MNKLNLKENVKVQHRIYYSFPNENEHENHITGEGSGVRIPVDKRIIQEVKRQVLNGVQRVGEMKRHLKRFVDEVLTHELPQRPSPLNRRFFPENKDIGNYICAAIKEMRLSKLDQENLELNSEIWKDENNVFFRPHLKQEDEEVFIEEKDDDESNLKFVHTKNNFLFCFQNNFQRSIMKKYGNEISLLDATYKTSKYALPLFFICVPTNNVYQVVGFFVVHYETEESIKEALSVFQNWNPEWRPKCWMSDFCKAEINALEFTFPAITTWCNKSENGVRKYKDNIEEMTKLLAGAKTEEDFNQALDSFKETTYWKCNKRLRDYFEKVWLPEKKRWVKAYRLDRFLTSLNTNNGIERQNRILKYDYLRDKVDRSITSVCQSIIEEFLPESMVKYIKNNIKALEGYSAYPLNIPEFLLSRPAKFYKHVYNRWSKAEAEYCKKDIELINKSFTVRSETYYGQHHIVSFGTEEKMPSCTCQDWVDNHLPCKHFCAIFIHNKEWQWDRLPSWYRDSPFFVIDLDDARLTNQPPNKSQQIPTLSNNGTTDGSYESDKCQFDDVRPHKASGTSKFAKENRETLKKLEELTYKLSCHDQRLLNSHLRLLLREFQEKVPNESGFLLEEPELVENSKRKSSANHYGDLPINKKRKFSRYGGPPKNFMMDGIPMNAEHQSKMEKNKIRKVKR
ncbi:uncharacterized protein LOC117100667 [Anneissia japonica]|uniref:uncharacterized protein LOC117100667 n=1 Tax=Anneissia japonica TaxID=1529436 RepID=UPI00142556B7|nr:uncharacterized protein LOC117100667 [Anneissia japonica]